MIKNKIESLRVLIIDGASRDDLLDALDKLLAATEKTQDIICNEIDFGTGKLFYSIKKESAMSLNDLMNVITEKSMIVPLQSMVRAIKNLD